jgi:anaerobic dimethyl sulfoxide reductase subunit C (anchor subunit)
VSRPHLPTWKTPLGEWPLVAFTLVAQLAVGVLVVTGGCTHLLGAAWSSPDKSSWRLLVLAGVLAALAIAAILSLFHLHRPARAHTALANLRSSWLSREILSLITFGALVSLLALVSWWRAGGAALERALYALAALAGLALIASMAKLYMLPTAPPWRGPVTLLSFVLTALLVGTLASVFLFAATAQPAMVQRALAHTATTLVAATMLVALLLTPEHGLWGARPGPSLRPPARGPRGWHIARLLLLALALVVLLIMPANRHATTAIMAALAFSLILAAELLGRFHFYALMPRRG